MTTNPLMTRKELIAHIRAKAGIPITYGTFAKLASTGRGPRVAAAYGKHLLHDPDEGLAWAMTLIRPVADQAQAA
jgi:hypothetical protein